MADNKFNDPLAALINQHAAASGNTEKENDQTVEINETPTAEVVESTSLADIEIDDEYGDNDNAAEIAAENAADEAVRNELKQTLQQQRDAEAAEKTNLPPQSFDPQFQKEAVDHQANNLGVVTTMVNKVVAKYHLIEGSIPDIDPRTKLPLKMPVQGDLIEQYHLNGEVITPEFEDIILRSWYLPSGQTAKEAIASGTLNQTTTNTTVDENGNTVEKTDGVTMNVNVTVEPEVPVSINIDESLFPNEVVTKEVNIHVHEVSEEELRVATIIENSQQPGIIKPYDSGIKDVPITLPLSAYRCVIRPINYFDFMSLSAPVSDSPSDNELKRWSIIYDHTKNVSIGAFKSLDDFMRKTKYYDRELFMWALLVATSEEEETITLTCLNKKCNRNYEYQYSPRTIVHMDDPEAIPKHYTKAYNAAIGEEAVELWKKVSASRRVITLPSTGIQIEITEPSAYDFVRTKLPLISRLLERYKPGKTMNEVRLDDPTLAQFNYLSAHAMYIQAVAIPVNGKLYRYTNWDDIEEIITKSLNDEDSMILFHVITNARTRQNPIQFYLSDVTCPYCGRHDEKLIIEDIANSLLFQASRRLTATTVNLIETE